MTKRSHAVNFELTGNLSEMGRRVSESNVESIDEEIYNYENAEDVFFVEQGSKEADWVVKFFDENRTYEVGKNTALLEAAGISYPPTVYGPVEVPERSWEYCVVQPRMNQTWYEEICRDGADPVKFVEDLERDVIEPAAEAGLTVDIKHTNLYRDTGSQKIGVVDVQDGISVKIGEKDPENWMWFNFQMQLRDEKKELEGVKDALNAIPD